MKCLFIDFFVACNSLLTNHAILRYSYQVFSVFVATEDELKAARDIGEQVHVVHVKLDVMWISTDSICTVKALN